MDKRLTLSAEHAESASHVCCRHPVAAAPRARMSSTAAKWCSMALVGSMVTACSKSPTPASIIAPTPIADAVLLSSTSITGQMVPGNTVRFNDTLDYTLASAAQGVVRQVISNQNGIIGSSPQVAVNRGSGKVTLTNTVVIPIGSTTVCDEVSLIANGTTLAAQKPCFPLVKPNHAIMSVTGGWVGEVVRGRTASLEYTVVYTLESPAAQVVLVVSDDQSHRIGDDVSVPVRAGSGTVALSKTFQIPPNTKFLCPTIALVVDGIWNDWDFACVYPK